MKTNLEHARGYHKQGWNVIPIAFKQKTPLRGFSWKPFQTQEVTEENLQEWFGNDRYRNMAVMVGDVSGGLTILDFDKMELYEQWKSKHNGLAETLPTVKTSRGMHVYFRSEEGKTIAYNKIDLLVSRKYVLLPPSIHPDGPTYEWIIPPNGELPVLDPDEYKLDRLTEETEDREEIEEIEAIYIGKDNCIYLPDFLKKYNFDKNKSKKIYEAITHTQPKTEGQRNKKIFYFCRWLKGVPELADLPVKELKPIVREWHQKALPVIGTKSFMDTWADFTYGYKRVKWPKGDDTLEKAVQLALKAQDILPEAEDYDSTEGQYLIRICYELQKLQGKEPFWLSCRSAGGILGVSHETANKYLQMLVTDDVLKVLKEHTSNEATRFKYIGG